MKFRKAIEQSIRAYYNGKLPEKAIEASEEEFIYTMEYFENATVAEPEETKDEV